MWCRCRLGAVRNRGALPRGLLSRRHPRCAVALADLPIPISPGVHAAWEAWGRRVVVVGGKLDALCCHVSPVCRGAVQEGLDAAANAPAVGPQTRAPGTSGSGFLSLRVAARPKPNRGCSIWPHCPPYTFHHLLHHQKVQNATQTTAMDSLDTHSDRWTREVRRSVCPGNVPATL